MPVQIPSIVHESLLDQALPSLQVGGALGVSGLVASGVFGQSAALATTVGVQCFYLGTATFYSRHALLIASRQPRTKNLELGCSGVAGALSGALSGALNKGSSIFRPALLAGTTSIAAQAAFHAFRDGRAQDTGEKSLTDRIAKILPLRSLSDTQYENMLREKLGKIDVEISMLDDQIAELKQREAEVSLGAKP